MASNFKIFRHQNSSNLHLKLFGDFDGSSAFELLNTINDFNRDNGKIFIHTQGLNCVDSFGKYVFQNNISNLKKPHVIFTGEHAADMEING